MMGTKKEAFLADFQKAKDAHKKVMQSIELALNGIESKHYEPLSKFDCTFGRWLYSDEKIKTIIGVQLYEKIESFHAQWHTIYSKIYPVIAPKEEGFLGKLFKHKPSPLEIDKAKVYYDDLKEVTATILHLLETAERRIQALAESKF